MADQSEASATTRTRRPATRRQPKRRENGGESRQAEGQANGAARTNGSAPSEPAEQAPDPDLTTLGIEAADGGEVSGPVAIPALLAAGARAVRHGGTVRAS